MRIALAHFVQESNSFSPVPGSWFHLPPGSILRGEEIIAQRTRTNTEIGGAIDVAQAQGMTLVPLLSVMTAASAAPMLDEVFNAILNELLTRVRGAAAIDGVILVLHGAMATESYPDATGKIIQSVREVVPNAPIAVTLDLHANVTRQMLDNADVLVAYHTAPHIDMYQTGQRALRLLAQIVRGEVEPVAALRRLPMILPAENGRTTEGPYAEVMNRALELMLQPGVLDISVCSVQPWLDVAGAACTVLVNTNADAVLADQLADELADMFWERRHRFAVDLVPTTEALRLALSSDRYPFVLADSADAPSSGAPGDSTIVLEQLIALQPTRLCLHNIVDAQSVAAMFAAGEGAAITIVIGASSGASFYQPIQVTGRVRRLSDGDFMLKGEGYRGIIFRRGRTAVFDIGQIALVVMERPVLQWDPELYRSLDLDPAKAQVVIVKSPAAFRAAYEPLATEVLVIDAPGVCSPNLLALPFVHARPAYPFDTIEHWREAAR